MRRWLSGLCVTLALLALVVLPGCDVRMLRVVIPDFETAQVEGVRVFRLDDASGQPIDAGELLFGSTSFDEKGQEFIEYVLTTPDGEEFPGLVSGLVRDDANPNQVTVVLFFQLEQMGWHKVATFNGLGTSALSLNQTFF